MVKNISCAGKWDPAALLMKFHWSLVLDICKGADVITFITICLRYSYTVKFIPLLPLKCKYQNQINFIKILFGSNKFVTKKMF